MACRPRWYRQLDYHWLVNRLCDHQAYKKSTSRGETDYHTWYDYDRTRYCAAFIWRRSTETAQDD